MYYKQNMSTTCSNRSTNLILNGLSRNALHKRQEATLPLVSQYCCQLATILEQRYKLAGVRTKWNYTNNKKWVHLRNYFCACVCACRKASFNTGHYNDYADEDYSFYIFLLVGDTEKMGTGQT